MKKTSLLIATLVTALYFNTASASEPTVYDQLGGEPVITKVVDDLINNVTHDNRISSIFANANLPHLKKMLVEQICNVSGGPCTYTGKNMPDAHKGMNLKSADFNALVEDLQIAFRQNNVPLGAQNKLLAILAPMKPDVDHK